MPKAIPYVPYAGPVVKRQDAKSAGQTRYFTGTPCCRGHIAQRFVSTCSCLICWREDGKRFRALNRDKARRYENTYRAANPEKVKAKKQRNYQRHRDVKVAKGRDWRAANIVHAREASKEWKLVHWNQHKTNSRNRRARVRNADGSHTGDQILDLLGKQRNRCAACRKELTSRYHADHVVPLARGGSNDIRNIQLLCPTCNDSKGHSHPIVWARKKGLLL